ncbi:MAG TPA: hypothetical protein VNW46_05240 [Gemmatimonadaceae bacterium]|nr:hypothetical protein [Gemmatimonadaceae bacterium]
MPFLTALQVSAVTGRVDLVGTDPLLTIVVIPTTDPKHHILLDGPLMTQLRHVNGLEVELEGQMHGRFLTVRQFTVVAANGVPATDGRLVAAGGDTLVLITADGVHHHLVHPSPSLRSEVGGRIWLSGPLDREPVAYGLIDNSP